MISRRRHLRAICELVDRELAAEPRNVSRRLLGPRLRWAAETLDPELAAEGGVLELVERCRDEHLASLDADDGLAVLALSWEEIVTAAASYRRRPEPATCPRCGARLPARRHRCGRCGLRR